MTIVKALEWHGSDGWLCAESSVTSKSYTIAFEEGSYWACWDASLPPFPTLEAAKAAAQADYEARILSALTPAPDLASENERLRAALGAIIANHETVGAGASIFQCTTAEVDAAKEALERT